MKEPNDDFLNHIKSTLREHEEAYDEGAWERFTIGLQQPTIAAQKKIVPIWKWAAAAAALIACILLIGSIFRSSNNNIINHSDELVKQQPFNNNTTPATGSNSLANGSPNNNDMTTTSPTPLNKNKNQPIVGNAFEAPGISLYRSDKPVALAYIGQHKNIIKSIIAAPQIQQQALPYVFVPRQVFPQPNNILPKNNLEVQKEKAVAEPEDNDMIAFVPPVVERQSESGRTRRWQPSLFISPLFGEHGVSVGYGGSLAYAFNDKVKIISGIAHAKISASRSYDVNNPASVADANPVAMAGGTSPRAAYSLATAQQTTSLQQVNGYISGLDIPLEVSYNISKKLYATAGVSGLIVLNDNKQFTYIDSRNVKVSVVETSDGNLKENKSITLKDKNTTTIPIQAPNESTTFLGFYNISIGFKQKIAGKNAVSLEPFVKIPVKNVTQQNLNYMGTGIRLKFDF